MATIRQRGNGTFELRVVNKALPRPFYSTHDTRQEAEDYARRLVEALGRGQVPPELLTPIQTRRIMLSAVLRQYLNEAPIARTDRPLVEWLQENLKIAMQDLTVRWVDQWVAGMKKGGRLAPGSIRKRVESLARAVDWHLRQQGSDATNPLRTLPRGYSGYAAGERTDTVRDRRLLPGEYERIEATLLGRKRHDSAEFLLLFRLLVHTGLRLGEAYRLQGAHIRMAARTIHVSRSKTGRARDVPMTKAVVEMLAGADEKDLVFPFWDGTPEGETQTTRRLSARFVSTFEYAGCVDLTAHDLRHEATCRWMEMRDASGQWLFRPEEVRRITGHRSEQMFFRYFSMRGSDLAARLD